MNFQSAVSNLTTAWLHLDEDGRRFIWETAPALAAAADALNREEPKLKVATVDKGAYQRGGQAKPHLRDALVSLARAFSAYDAGPTWGFGKRRNASLRAFARLTGDDISTDKGIVRYFTDDDNLGPHKQIAPLLAFRAWRELPASRARDALPRESLAHGTSIFGRKADSNDV